MITGGASGIGERTAGLFIAEGAGVVIADPQRERGRARAAELGAAAVFEQVEVRQEAPVTAAIERARTTWGRLDCLFNNAGFGGVLGSVEDIPGFWPPTVRPSLMIRRWGSTAASATAPCILQY